jgi:hypothetical protein
MRAAGSNFRTLKRLIKRYDISTEHLDPNWVLRGDRPNRKIPLEQIMVENSSYGRDKLKRRLYEAELKHRRCELCGQGEEWNGRRMSLILDHVNGVATDNRLENLRIVCPNCNATLDTHCGRRTRLDVPSRACLHCGAEFVPRYATHRYCSHLCGTRWTRSREPQPHSRKVQRPPSGATDGGSGRDELLRDRPQIRRERQRGAQVGPQVRGRVGAGSRLQGCRFRGFRGRRVGHQTGSRSVAGDTVIDQGSEYMQATGAARSPTRSVRSHRITA